MADTRVTAYDTNTGEKLPALVPEGWFGLFPNLTKTEPSKRRKKEDSSDA